MFLSTVPLVLSSTREELRINGTVTLFLVLHGITNGLMMFQCAEDNMSTYE